MVLESFCGRVGWGSPQTFSPCNGADSGDVSVDFRVLFKIVEYEIHHSSEPDHIGLCRAEFLLGVQNHVLVSDARTMEVERHAAQLLDEFVELFISLW